MTEIEEDLNAVSADLVDDAERLRAIELEKSSLTPGDDRIVQLSAEADALLPKMRVKGKAEYALAVEAEAASHS